MKRITLFMVALIAFFSSTSIVHADGETTGASFSVADTATDVSKITEGYYILRSRCKGIEGTVYSSENSSNASKLIHTSSVTYKNVTATQTQYLWYVTRTENGLVIQNVGTGAYIPRLNGRGSGSYKNMAVSKTIDNAGILEGGQSTIPTDSLAKLSPYATTLYQVQYTLDSKKIYIHTNGDAQTGYLSYWEGGTYSGDNPSILLFAFYEVKCASLKTMTKSYAVKVTGTDGTASYSVETNGQDIENGSNYVTEWKASGEEASYWYNPVYTFTVSDETKTVSIENASFTVSEQKVSYTEGDAPFEYYTESNPVLYTINFRKDTKKYLVHQATTDNNMSTGYTFANIANENYTKFKGALWGFVKDGYGVKLLSYQMGTYVTVANGDNTTQATLSANGTTFIALTNTTGGFTLKVKGVDHSVIGDHVNSTLGVWNADISKIQNDGGSNFGITKVNTDILAVGLKAMQAGVKSDYTWSNDTYLTMDASPVLDAVNNASTPTSLTDLETLESTVESKSSTLYISDPGEGYYKLSCIAIDASANKYATSEAIHVATNGDFLTAYNNDNSMDRTVHRTSSSGALVPMLWKLVKYSDNNYYICNLNLDAYMSHGTGENADFPTQKGFAPTFTLENHATGAKSNYDRSTMFLLHSSTYYLNAYGGGTFDYLKHYINTDNGGLEYPTDNGNYWQLEKVTTIPVTTSSVGYTSICLPFAVEIPDGVTVYYATSTDDDKIYLEKYTGTVIPAQTGVIISGTASTEYSFNITTTDETISSNILKGSTAKRSGFDANTTYGLAKNSVGNAAFLINTLTYVPANKAYLLETSSSSESISAYNFDFGGVVDGLQTATTTSASETEVYYDLQGHRVFYPTKGIYVTTSGKKVLFK